MPPNGKARRQDQDVVAVPAVRAVEALRRLHHLLGVGELRCRAGRRPTARRRRRCAARAARRRGRRPRSPSGTPGSAAACGTGTRRRGRPVELPAAPMSATRSGGVRTVASNVTRTAGVSWTGTQLRAWIAWDCEKRKGWRLPGRLGRREPLEARRPGAGRVVDAHAVVAGPQRDREGRAEDRVGGSELPGGAGVPARAAGLRAADLEGPRVERGGPRPTGRGARNAGSPIRGGIRRAKVHLEIELDVPDADLGGVGVGVNVAGSGRLRHARTA